MNSKTYHIKLNGKVYEVEIEEVAPGQKVQTESKVETKQETKPQVQKTQATDGEPINAPMPGTITNILVNDGQNVRKGDVLAILEAMKMENEIVAPRDGVINNISVDKGQSVNHGEKLLEMA